MSDSKYILAIDDSGTQIIRPPTAGRAFVMGGIVTSEGGLERFRNAWRSSTKGFELVQTGHRPRTPGDIKAVDFLHNFPGSTVNEEQRAAPAFAMFTQLAGAFDLLPLVIIVDKCAAGDDLLSRTKKGEPTIRQTEFLPILLGTFANFLAHKRSYGRVRMDRLKSAAEEAEFRAAWDVQVKGLRKISRELEFVESAHYPEVQAADVMLGLLRGQHEKDAGFPKQFGDLLRKAESAGIRVVHYS